PETQQYVEEELAYTRSILDPLPGRDKIHARLEQLLTIGNIVGTDIGGDWYFQTRREGKQNQPVLYVRQGVNGQDRALVNVNALSQDGTVALDWWTPSHDGRYVAFGTSPSGSEKSTLHVVETATGKQLTEAIAGTRFSSVAWKKDDTGFFYTRYPKPGSVPAGEENYNQRVFYHPIGDDAGRDALIFGEGRPKEDVYAVNLSDDDRWLTIIVQQGWTKSEIFQKDLKANAAPVQVTDGRNFLYQSAVYRGVMYMLTNEDTPRYHVLTAPAASPQRANWKELIPQSDAVLKDFGVIDGKIFAQYEKNVSSVLKVFTLDGKPLRDVPLPGIGVVNNVSGDYDTKDALIRFESFTVPPTVLRYEMERGQESTWAKVNAPIDPAPYEVKQVWYTSKDGTRVPMFIVSKKGLVLDGNNPTLLYGYGGFQVSETPAFSRGLYLWLEHGGVYALANLRGGSEFGEEWHRAGMLDKKQNVFDDFIAAAEYLIAQKYTNRDRLAIQGGSNGGLLTGAVLTQRPDLFRAVVCQVPLLDMLRYQNFQIARLWIPEYGSAEDPKQFEYLYAYSPYHHVKPGVEYPAVLFMTADTDTRVDPMHAKKMAALLQAEAKNGADRNRPILLRVDTKAGHGQGKPVSKVIEDATDLWSFLFWQLGVKP
ncbi:MAG: S9 family peptidase, partial [Acidobacteria bacterium]|nr:S9 family peptidase [Acidobacteriota bacterium]